MTHVCKQWRNAGIDLRELWAGVVCLFPAGVETIVHRTKDLSLPLDCTRTKSMYKGYQEDLWAEIERLNLLPRAQSLSRRQVISFTVETIERGPSTPVDDWSLSLVDQYVPQLQELTLYIYFFTDVSNSTYQPPDTPFLRRLSINVPFMVICPSLFSFHASGDLWTIKLLIKFLETNPSLTELKIDSISGDAEITDFGQSAGLLVAVRAMHQRTNTVVSVRLPDLQMLSIRHCGSRAARLLQCLELPVITHLSIEHIADRSDLLTILPRLDLICHVPRTILTLSDVGDDCSFGNCKIFLTEYPPHIGYAAWDFAHGIMLEQHTIRGRYADDDTVSFVLTSIPTPSTVKTLVFHHDCLECYQPCFGLRGTHDRDGLTRALKLFDNVTTLELIGQECYYGVPAVLFQETPQAESTLPLPALREFILTVDWITERSWWSGIRAALNARRAAGSQLHRLVVRGGRACHAVWPDEILPTATTLMTLLYAV